MSTHHITEVGPRDGLQNEPALFSAEKKAALIDHLYAAGLQRVEIGSFVSPKWVPAMENSQEVARLLSPHAQEVSMALVPNEAGFKRFAETRIGTVAVFAAATETFSQKNTNASIAQVQGRLAPVIQKAKAQNIKVRGYISCVFGCPYEGAVPMKAIDQAIQFYLHQGCQEIVLSDTIGVATPRDVSAALTHTQKALRPDQTALHFHDTYGQALANILRALDFGVTQFDSAIAGLGGCPYAGFASGNIATEDLVYMFDGLGLKTSVNLDKLLVASAYVRDVLQVPLKSKVATAKLNRL